MKRFLLATTALLISSPALAQHEGHRAPPVAAPAPAPTPEPRPDDPHAGHDMSAMEEPATTDTPQHAPAPSDPHAGHDMSAMTSQAADPHAGHDMSAAQRPAQTPAQTQTPAPTQADPHAGHDMSAMAPQAADPHAGHDMSSMTPQAGNPHAGHDMSAMGGHAAPGASMDHSGMQMDMSSMQGMAMDLNDYNWDAYLTNDRTLSDPEIIMVEKGGRVKLRVINGASATVFWIDTGGLSARLVAVDGHAIAGLEGSRFGIAMGQRLDLDLELAGEGAWPVLASREGSKERTGLILATPGATIEKIPALGEADAPAFDIDLSQELKLRASDGLPSRAPQRSHMVMLGGSMQPYVWTIDGKVWGDHKPLLAKTGERVEIMFHNMSMMGHPMHLHGHVFQVVDINGKRFDGARRDTVYVPPMAMVTVALDAGEAARWMLHCHHMPHLQTGMMTELSISA